MRSNMKLLLLIFILYIHYSVSQLQREDPFNKFTKQYPKKVGSGLIQYNDAGKYFKPAPKIAKKAENLRDYTVFPKPFPNGNEEQVSQQIVPESSFFPIVRHGMEESRTRVKKVLPEYGARYKRSVYEKAEGIENSKAPAKLSSKKEGGVKKTKVPKRNGKDEGLAQRSKAKVKPSSKHQVQGKKLNAAKRGRARIAKKKRDLTKTRNSNRTHARSSKLKHSASQQKRKLSHQGRKKKLKSTNNNKISNPKDSAQKMKKTGRSKQEAKSLLNGSKNPQAKLSQKQHDRNSKTRGVRNRKDAARRLIAGRDALIEKYPYVVSIQKDRQHWCSGAILNPRLVITTANCLWKANSISRMRVRAGSRHTDRGGQVAKIQEVMKHPGWKIRRNPDDDVALVLLDRKIRFSHSLHGVDLPNRVMMPPFDDVWITSWGSERRDGIFDNKGMSLQVYHSRLMDRDKCNNVTQRFGVTVTENFICLAQTGRRAPCTRDTGAPAVSDGVLWGLASWGIRKLCGTERFPAMFSYIASHSNMDFIVNATHYLMADERYDPFPDHYPIPKFTLTTPTPLTLPY